MLRSTSGLERFLVLGGARARRPGARWGRCRSRRLYRAHTSAGRCLRASGISAVSSSVPFCAKSWGSYPLYLLPFLFTFFLSFKIIITFYRRLVLFCAKACYNVLLRTGTLRSVFFSKKKTELLLDVLSLFSWAVTRIQKCA